MPPSPPSQRPTPIPSERIRARLRHDIPTLNLRGTLRREEERNRKAEAEQQRDGGWRGKVRSTRRGGAARMAIKDEL